MQIFNEKINYYDLEYRVVVVVEDYYYCFLYYDMMLIIYDFFRNLMEDGYFILSFIKIFMLVFLNFVYEVYQDVFLEFVFVYFDLKDYYQK